MERETILSSLDRAVGEFGDRPQLFGMTDRGYEGRSFRRLRDDGRALAAWFLSRGIGKGSNVIILGEGSPEWVAAEIAVLAAGGVSVPLSIKLLAEEIPFRVSHCGAAAFVTTRNQLEKCVGALRSASLEPLVVYLDDDAETPDAACARTGFARDGIVRYADALAEGYALLPGRSGELDAIADGTSADDVVTISYTSGTTGDPKGIMLTHRNYMTNCEDGGKLFDTRGLSTLLILPVDHSFAHTVGIFSAIRFGIRLYFVDARGGGMGILRNIPVNLRQAEPAFLLTVPALSGNFMRKILAGVEEKGGLVERLFKAGIGAGIAVNGNGFDRSEGSTPLRRLTRAIVKALLFDTVRKKVFGRNIRYFVGGGALLDVKQQEFFAAFGLPVYQGYGLTEAAPVISSNTPDRHKYGTSGVIAPSVECTIRRADGTACGTGETGEIVIRGGNVMKGYYRNPEATAKVLRQGWLWTGDLGYLDTDGFLVVVGREKALLIAEDGEKYSPEEIEEAVGASTDAFTAVMAFNDMRKFTVALVTLDEDLVRRAAARGRLGVDEAMGWLQEEFFRFKAGPKGRKIPSAWSPATFMIVPGQFSDRDGTLNSTMKLVRRRVTEVHAGLIEYAYTREGSVPGNPRNLEALRVLLEASGQ